MTSYHMEALRKQRVIDRKAEAMKRLQDEIGQSHIEGITESKPDPLKFSNTDHWAGNRLTFYKIGTVRDMRQYDHSRDGPIVDRSKRALTKEFNFLGNSLSMLKKDIVPEHKSIPLCRRF